MATATFIFAAVSGFLLGWWKVPLVLAPFIAWAWLVSTKLEKDARYFHLPWQMWNGIYLGAFFAAMAVYLIPSFFSFWIAWPLSLLILAGPVVAYWKYRNARVPESKRYYITSETFSSKMEARRRARASREVALQFIDAKEKPVTAPLKEEPLYETHMLAEDVIGPALRARASRVDIALTPKGARVVQTIDGVQYPKSALPVEPTMRMFDFLKGITGLAVEDRRRQQAGDFRVKSGPPENLSAQVHMVTAGSSNGQVLRLEFDRAERLSKPFDGLGLLAPQVEALQPLMQPANRHGIVLIGAPAGHGLSTSMYAFLNRHDAYTSNIKSLERDIQVRLDGVDQVRFDIHNPDIDYATNLQSMLRRDPDIVMVDELDVESARVATDPGMDGPLIYVPQRAGTVLEQIQKWMKLVNDPKRAIKPLRAVVNQRLMRTLCPNCRQAFTPTPDFLSKLGIQGIKVNQLYRKSGQVQVKNKVEPCPVCNGIGYLGQTAAFEVMVLDDEMRSLLIAGDLKGAFDHARRNKMIYLSQAALTKVVAGETSVDELLRITGKKPAQKKAAASETKENPTPVG